MQGLPSARLAGRRPCPGPGKHRIQVGLEHCLDEAVHPFAQAGFDRIKPG